MCLKHVYVYGVCVSACVVCEWCVNDVGLCVCMIIVMITAAAAVEARMQEEIRRLEEEKRAMLEAAAKRKAEVCVCVCVFVGMQVGGQKRAREPCWKLWLIVRPKSPSLAPSRPSAVSLSLLSILPLCSDSHAPSGRQRGETPKKRRRLLPPRRRRVLRGKGRVSRVWWNGVKRCSQRVRAGRRNSCREEGEEEKLKREGGFYFFVYRNHPVIRDIQSRSRNFV